MSVKIHIVIFWVNEPMKASTVCDICVLKDASNFVLAYFEIFFAKLNLMSFKIDVLDLISVDLKSFYLLSMKVKENILTFCDLKG